MLDLSQEYDYELIICGDLNARVGTLSEIVEADINVPALEEFENVFQTSFVGPRSTCDVSVNTAGRELIDLCKIYGLYILNGRFQPDKDIGNFTHLCTNGSSVIDYGMCTMSLIQNVMNFSVEERTEPDYLPILITFEGHQDVIFNTTSNDNTDMNFLGYKIPADHKHLFTSKLSDILTNTVMRGMCFAIDNDNLDINIIIYMFLSIFRQAGEDFKKKQKRS